MTLVHCWSTTVIIGQTTFSFFNQGNKVRRRVSKSFGKRRTHILDGNSEKGVLARIM